MPKTIFCYNRARNVRYTKNLPPEFSVSNGAAAATARSPRQTQLDFNAVQSYSSTAGLHVAQELAGHIDLNAEDEQWRQDLLVTLNNKLATRELLAMEGTSAADLRVLDDEIAAIREARCRTRVVDL